MAEAFELRDRTLLVTNRASGSNLRFGTEGVSRAAAAVGLRHCCIDDMEGLADVLEKAAIRGDRLLIINAGDGTVCKVLQFIRERGMFTRQPILALLRGGTTNMIHNNVGMPGRPESALRTLLDRLASGDYTYTARHTLRVSRSSGGTVRYGFFFATHAATKAIVHTRERIHERLSAGPVSELLAIAGILWRLLRRRVEDDPVLSPTPLLICHENDAWREETHILMLAMSVRKTILGIRPLRCGQRAGLASLNWPDYRLVPWLWRFVRGSLEEFSAVSLRGRFSWILDGEVYEQHDSDGDLRIDVDEPVRFLVKT